MLRLLGYLFSALLALGVVAAGAAYVVIERVASDLPDYQQLAAYDPPTVTRVHAADGRLVAEYAIENRVFVPIQAIPKRVVDAFLSAEDKNFYSHPGIDLQGIARAVVQNVTNFASNRRPVGASTITQQVAKNFLLSNEVSLERKLKEAILAYRIEQAFSKDRILELYLNEIYLGFGTYGVATASLNYFNKPLDELTVAEAAFLAALPKAPNNYHPTRRPEAAKARRDYVLERMAEDGVIGAEEARAATASPIQVRTRTAAETVRADAFAEEVRRELMKRFGEKALYQGGLSVHATLDPAVQAHAETAFREGLIAYDRRHGWRGPIATIATEGEWKTRLAAVPAPPGLAPWRLAVVLAVGPAEAAIGLPDGTRGRIPLDELRWARENKPDQKLGPPVRSPRDVLEVGNVVAVERLADIAAAPPPSTPPARGRRADPAPAPAAADAHALRQMPDVSGGLVAMDPHTGRVLAMVGGFSFEGSQFNRATQAQRQPGSAFKPFVYTAALEAGLPPNTIVLDAPFVFDPGPGQERWKPANFGGRFNGPSTMRMGIELSRNLMTVRLAENIGMERVADMAKRFGVFDDMQPVLSLSLGAGETTLMRMTAAYAAFANGGKKVTPTIIDRVQDRNGKTIFRHDARPCPDCAADAFTGQAPPTLPDARLQIVDPQIAYQMTSMLEGVVLRGTGARAAALRRPLAGKTGTTNDSFDNWFVGFAPDLAVGVYLGFDKPRTLGKEETGGGNAVPIFTRFMQLALKDAPVVPFRVPPGLKLVRINRQSGELAQGGEGSVILEAFRPGTEPGPDGPPSLAGAPLTASTGTDSGGAPPSAPPPLRAITPAAAPSGIY